MFLTSDLHFSHQNILKYCSESRPFSSVEEMNAKIIENWNNKVPADGVTYILGDVMMGGVTKMLENIEYIKALNGIKHLVVGNHDKMFLKYPEFVNCFETVQDLVELEYKGNFLVLFHYPIQKWNAKHNGSYHFHGHLHSVNNNPTERIWDVGLDGSKNFCPYHVDEFVEKLI